MSDKLERIGVLGAGTMGAGIAQVAAQAGFETFLYDISQEFIDTGMGRIRGFLQGSRERGKITADQEKRILDRLRPTWLRRSSWSARTSLPAPKSCTPPATVTGLWEQ